MRCLFIIPTTFSFATGLKLDSLSDVFLSLSGHDDSFDPRTFFYRAALQWFLWDSCIKRNFGIHYLYTLSLEQQQEECRQEWCGVLSELTRTTKSNAKRNRIYTL